MIIGIAFGILKGLAGDGAGLTIINLIDTLVSIAFILPGIAVAVRRLHDTGRSGWWYLLVFTIVGIIPLIIWFCANTDPKANKWGAPAK